MLFRFENVAKEFGAHKVFSGVTIQANTEDRIGLIGRNGSGKTTLLDLIEGRLEADEGRLLTASGLTLSRIRQIPELDPLSTVRDCALQVFLHFETWEARLRVLETVMAESRKVETAIASEYEQLRTRLRLEGGYDYQARTEAVLLGLGFRLEDLDAPCARLSGGQVSRLALAQSLLQPAALLLLDEPTNHLDLRGTLWLENYLKEQPQSFVLISHDRHFLDQVTTVTWELENGSLTAYRGAFSVSRRRKDEIIEQRWAEYQRQQEWKAKTEDFIRRNLYGQKTKQAQSRRRQLERTEWLERPPEPRLPPRLRIPEAKRGGAVSFSLAHAAVGYPGRPLIEGVDLTVHRGERIAILGENGSGKTSLLKSLRDELPLLRGRLTWGANLVPAYFSQNPDLGDENRTVYDCLRELDLASTDEQLRSYAARFLFREEEIFKPVNKLSGGERSRLALARLFYSPCNVLFMDEPTNHLDIDSREALESALRQFEGSLVIVSHDLYFLENVVDAFFLIRDQRLQALPALTDLPRLLLEKPAESRASAPRPVPKPKAAPSAPSLSKNERRRRESRLKQLEEEIEALEGERRQVVELVQSGSDYAELQRLSARAELLGHQLEALYLEWEAAALELSEDGATGSR